MSATMLSLRAFLEEQRARVDSELERLIPGAEVYPPSIHQAMRHSVFAGGKRLRPILCIEAGRMFDGDEASLLRLGCSLEMIHTYSLIHDDLPALDNDDLRRGKPTCHRAFGEATAILAGDALLTLAFETLAEPVADLSLSGRRLRVIHELAHAIGTRGGMVAGQVVDLETTLARLDATTLEFIHSAKTGAFIRAAVRSGALDAGAEGEDIDRLTAYGERIGLAFQIADDLLDVTGSDKSLGKTPGKDERQHKATYPALHGVEKSRHIAAELIRDACETLEPFGARAARLVEIAEFLIERTS